jgi:CHASE3 domain sensor protein
MNPPNPPADGPERRSTTGRRVLAAFVVTLAVLVVFSTTSYRRARSFIENSREVSHTQEVLKSLERVSSLAAQEESDARGFEIVRDAKLLHPYFEATAMMRAQIAELRRLTADNPAQQKRLDGVAALSGWQSALAENVMRRGPRAAAALTSGDSARVMAKLRAAIDEMQSEERRLLEERSARASADANDLTTLLIGAGVARAAVVLLALFAILRWLAASGKSEEALRRARDEALKEAEARRIAQSESERLGERLSAVLDHIDVGVAVVELGGGLSIYNRAAERIHGAWRDELDRLVRAGSFGPMLEDEKTPFAPGEDPLGRALKGETVRDGRVFFRTPFRPNGYHLNVTAIPLRDPRRLPAGVVLMFTERKRAAP